MCGISSLNTYVQAGLEFLEGGGGWLAGRRPCFEIKVNDS